MLDGVKIVYRLIDFEAWKLAVKIALFTPTDVETGETKSKTRTLNGIKKLTITQRGNFETYLVTIKETTLNQMNGNRAVNHLLILDGSFHKNQFAGANYLPLTWDQLQNEINHLQEGLQLTGERAELVNLEIGLNIPLPFPVFPFLQKCLISYKGNSFNRYNPDKNGVCLGFVCNLSQYSVKIYDKGKQFNLPENLMRFEIRYLKMQILNKRGINTLNDLRNYKTVNGLLDLLLEAWGNILLFDTTINLKSQALKPKEMEILVHGSNPKFWEQLKEKNLRRFNYQRSLFKRLVARDGKGWHETINDLLKTEWENLFKNCTNLPTVQNPELNEFTIKIKGKNVQTRSCLSCGRDISYQNNRSKFCGPKHFGEIEAHRCRNFDSNPRNNLKKKIKIIEARGVLFEVAPFIIVKNNKIQSHAI
jgi:predicted RNA-binding Zn-ribbon protein involved in translation (DUF1610 family)